MEAAKLIKTVRKKLDLTQVQLAAVLGCHPITVNRWENGHEEPNEYRLALLEKMRDSKITTAPKMLNTRGAIYTLSRVLAA